MKIISLHSLHFRIVNICQIKMRKSPPQASHPASPALDMAIVIKEWAKSIYWHGLSWVLNQTWSNSPDSATYFEPINLGPMQLEVGAMAANGPTWTEIQLGGFGQFIFGLSAGD